MGSGYIGGILVGVDGDLLMSVEASGDTFSGVASSPEPFFGNRAVSGSMTCRSVSGSGADFAFDGEWSEEFQGYLGEWTFSGGAVTGVWSAAAP